MKSIICILVLQSFVVSKPSELMCRIQQIFQLNGLYQSGDIILGGIFALNYKTTAPDLSFTHDPGQWKCDGFEVSEYQRVQTMIFAIQEINNDQRILPNITLGYRIFDSCVNLPIALRAAVTLLSGRDGVLFNDDCKGLPPLLAIVGNPLSSHSIAMSRIMSLFRIPMVSHYATCSCLSDKQEYPSFLRTIPSDAFQVKAIIHIIKHFGWLWVGVIASDDDYGQNAVKSFTEEVNKIGCISFSESISAVPSKNRIFQIVNIIEKSTAKVIVAFSGEGKLSNLFQEIVLQNITGRQWIASEAWSTSNLLSSKKNFDCFGGTIGIAIRRGDIPGLQNFLLQVQPDHNPQNNLAIEFWETLFNCKFPETIKKQNFSVLPAIRVCTGSEDIKLAKTAYSDVTKLRSSYNVYKAVYAIAHALHNLIFCESGKGPFINNTCANITLLQPWQLLHYLKNVNFTNKLGERVAFNENGDAVGIYDIVNWQKSDDGGVTIKSIGFFDESAAAGEEVKINEDEIFWNFKSGAAPISICSKSCMPGTRKATRKGEPICCFDYSVECVKCPQDFWSNHERNQCIMKETEFLSYIDAMGITLVIIASFGACLSVMALAVFVYHRNTPVVKANNSELSFILLVSLTLCFLCSLCFIGQPSYATCMLRHLVFGVSFALCISCILVKTIVVIMAFKARQPTNNMMKWFGVSHQRGTVVLFTLIQSIICILWLSTAPPNPTKNTKVQNEKIILECDVGSVIGFSSLLGYIGLLASICFVLAFLARKLPDTFNEAKFITFSMLIFCAVWITFVPAYVSSPGKHTVAVEVFAILASSFGLLIAIFAPKFYIIIFKPEKNTKKALMKR
ncbi:CASR protein, partial [Polypterus senegalus]|nr:CASR protein [Polypterus senegalus]